jgi:hypothetical protein
MRHFAQRTILLQDCLPADKDSMGVDLSIGLQAQIDRAFKAWERKRGIEKPITFFEEKRRKRSKKHEVSKAV